MVLTSLIAVTDGFFIGNYVNKDGLAAVNLGLPIIYFYLAVGLMVSVGGISIAGIALGSNNFKKCNIVFNQTMLTVVVSVVMINAIMWFCLSPMLYILKADSQVAKFFQITTLLCFCNFPSW